LGPWQEASGGSGGRAWTQIDRSGAWFRADRADRVVTDVTGSAFEWFAFALRPAVLAFAATAIGTPADKRGAVAELLAFLAETMPDPSKLRVYKAVGTAGIDDELRKHMYVLRWHAGNAYAIRRLTHWSNVLHVLEYAPDGAWK